jgi:exosome complex component RRP45
MSLEGQLRDSARSSSADPGYRSSEDEVLITRLLEKSIRRTEAVDREALCIVAGEKVGRRMAGC